MVAQLLSAPVAAVLIALDGAGGLRGWQWLTLVEGGATVAVGLALPLALPHAPRHVDALTEKELAWVQSHVSRCATPDAGTYMDQRHLTRQRQPGVWVAVNI